VVNPGNGHEMMTNVRQIDVGNDGPSQTGFQIMMGSNVKSSAGLGNYFTPLISCEIWAPILTTQILACTLLCIVTVFMRQLSLPHGFRDINKHGVLCM
jgi:hypothetical protein